MPTREQRNQPLLKYWYCNKCGKGGQVPTENYVKNANDNHNVLSPTCDYLVA